MIPYPTKGFSTGPGSLKKLDNGPVFLTLKENMERFFLFSLLTRGSTPPGCPTNGEGGNNADGFLW
jgi:hypothetical protein